MYLSYFEIRRSAFQRASTDGVGKGGSGERETGNSSFCSDIDYLQFTCAALRSCKKGLQLMLDTVNVSVRVAQKGVDKLARRHVILYRVLKRLFVSLHDRLMTGGAEAVYAREGEANELS